MSRANLNDLQAFVAIAREGSFTRAAAQLGVSQSALSHTMRSLEERLGVRLLTRTTRSVSATEAGQRLFDSMAPRFEEIELELAAVGEFRDKPVGNVRITASEHAANNILWPKLHQVLPDYPDIKVEITVDYALSDIVAQRYDAGVRLGDQVAKDMIAVPIGPQLRMAVVASPEYFRRCKPPIVPGDLASHSCNQPATAHLRQFAAMGLRKRRPRIESEGRWSVDIQQQPADFESGDCWRWVGISPG